MINKLKNDAEINVNVFNYIQITIQNLIQTLTTLPFKGMELLDTW